MLSLLAEQQHFLVLVHPATDWMIMRDVLIEVTCDGVLQGNTGDTLPRMSWDAAYQAFAERLDLNEHQLSAMSKGFDRGRALRFELNCRLADLAEAGFLVGE